MSMRTDLVAAFEAGLPDYIDPTTETTKSYRVIGYPNSPDRLDQRTVAVMQTRVVPSTFDRDSWTVELVAWVLTPMTTAGRTDDDLDAALVDVLTVLHPLKWLVWNEATRGVAGDQEFNGYRITMTAAATITTED